MTEVASASIGVFDSGVGGLTVLHALHHRMPDAPLLYLGDSSHAPYGLRPPAQIIERCERIVRHLVDQGAGLIVVACNTATACAIDHLRDIWPGLPFVGIEPGIKPAVLQSHNHRIAVMATPATIASARLRRLIELHAQGTSVHLQACPELASAIEHGVLSGPVLRQMLQPWCAQIAEFGADTVVLGCTHYAFVAQTIDSLLGPGIALVDTAQAVARQVASRRAELCLAAAAVTPAPPPRLMSTGDPSTMQRLAQRSFGIGMAAVDVVCLE